ncbi:9317_t:CDS:1, partial [Dentiscutata erythropus]
IENNEGYLPPSESSNKDPNRAFLMDITITMNNNKSKEPKKRGGSRKRSWIWNHIRELSTDNRSK